MTPIAQITRPRDIRFWVAILVLVTASAAFAAIAYSVMEKAPILKQDMQVSVWLHTHNNAVFLAFLYAITEVHSPVGMTVIAALFGFWLWRSGHHYWTLSLAMAVPGGMLVNTIIKELVHRARPVWDDPVLTLSSTSFPSGHTAGATLFYGFVAAFIVWNTKEPWRHVVTVICCVLMVALVGFSRIYLGVHYLSDVLGAVSISLVWLVLTLIAVRGLAQRRGAA
jgi:membrane-associated phospholipid phosphatase